MFSTRLANAVIEKKNAVLVGLDPRWDSLPSAFRKSTGKGTVRNNIDAKKAAFAFKQFCCGVIDVVAPLVPAVKPQAAFFEQYGAAGMAALSDVIQYARQKGLLVIFDGKRNDIGTTAEAYAAGILGRDSAWGADALTVSPYLGEDSIEPFVKTAIERDAGIFVLVKTSNPGGAMLQDLVIDGKSVYRRVAEHVEKLARQSIDNATGYGNVGAVVGATWPEQLAELREAMPSAWFLVPGFGSQGGTAKDVLSAFDAKGLGAIINNSRGIIFAHSREPFASRYGESRWQEAVEAATREMIEQLGSCRQR